MKTLGHNTTPQTISELVHEAKELHDDEAMENERLARHVFDMIDNLYTTVSFMTPTTPECQVGLIDAAENVVQYLSEQDTPSPKLDVEYRKAKRCFDSALEHCGLSDTQFARLNSIKDKLSEYEGMKHKTSCTTPRM